MNNTNMATKPSRSRRSKSRGLTASQEAAHDRAYDACDHTVKGQFVKGQLVSDYFGRQAWKVATYGIRYHSDCHPLFGVLPTAAGPKGWRESVEIRTAIADVLERGTHTTNSRGADESAQDRPDGELIADWTDKRYDSLATCETISVYQGGIVGVVRPNYDDAASIIWVRDAKLAKRAAALIARCPEPVVLPTTTVQERTINVTMDADNPHYSSYLAGRDAKPYEPVTVGDRVLCAGGIQLPRSEWRRIKTQP